MLRRLRGCSSAEAPARRSRRPEARRGTAAWRWRSRPRAATRGDTTPSSTLRSASTTPTAGSSANTTRRRRSPPRSSCWRATTASRWSWAKSFRPRSTPAATGAPSPSPSRRARRRASTWSAACGTPSSRSATTPQWPRTSTRATSRGLPRVTSSTRRLPKRAPSRHCASPKAARATCCCPRG